MRHPERTALERRIAARSEQGLPLRSEDAKSRTGLSTKNYLLGPSPSAALASNLKAFSSSSTGPSKLGGVAIVPVIQP